MRTPNKYGLEFHHLGLAVKEPESAIRFLSGLGYEIGPTFRDELQNVNLMLGTGSDMPAVEIIYPTETPGPLVTILKARTSMIYHICYASRNRDESLRLLEADQNRISLLSPPQPAVLFGGRKVSFYVLVSFGVIEILEPG